MFVQPILNYFTVYVKIKVEGLFLERFINICVSKKILLMDIKREKSTIMYANVGIADYKKLKQVARKTKSKRKIFGILFVVILALLIVSSNYIWNIEISGNVKITNQEILQSLEESGLKVGLSKNDIDINAVISKIRLDREDIAWIGITVKGTNAIVKIKEAAKAPEVIDENKFCNIVANKTGMITKINVQNGTANVKVGDIVEEGDILVNGYLEGKYTGTRYVHGAATVEAKIWYTKKEKAMLKQQIPVQTGNEEKKYSIKLKKNQINLFKTLSKFEKYDTINENKKIILFSNFYLPIEVVKITNKEYVLQDVTYTNEEQTQILTEKLKKELLKEIGEQKNIVNVNVNTYSQDEAVEVEVTYEVLENIGVEQEMNI